MSTATPPRRPLTTTSYAVLGLLAVRSWSTYELTKQMERSLGRIWPRAASKLYEEPRKLVDHGLATAGAELVGARSRTVYAITPAGREALAEWLGRPGTGPVLECEQLVQVLFAEHGSRGDTLATLAATQAWAAERNADNLAAAQAYLAGQAPFQQRAAQTVLVGAFLTDFYAMVDAWAQRCAAVVERWPADPSDAHVDRAALEDVVRRASW